MKTRYIILFSSGIFLLLVSLVIVYMWGNGFSISTTGTIGDGFNGLLTPFISFAGALLVFLSFKEQIKANLIITSQWHFDLLLKSLNEVKQSYDNITLVIKKDHRSIDDPSFLKGTEALTKLGTSPLQPFDKIETALTDLHTVILEFHFVVDQIQKAQIDDKSFLNLKASVFYTKNLESQIEKIRKMIVDYKWVHTYPSLILAINDLQNMVLNLRTKGVWGGLD